MSLVKLWLLMILLGGAGGALGAIMGGAVGTGGAFAGGLLLGSIFVIVGGLLATRWHWIAHPQRLWAIVGGVAGCVLAALVTLSTLTSPVAPLLSTLLIGTGAALGAVVGNSAHAEA